MASGLAITGHSRVYGIIGWPVHHSLSPVMHNRAFAVLGYPGVYVPFPVEPGRLAAALEGARALGVAGLNVTVPHKEAVLPLLDEVSEAAGRIGAVNTIAVRDGRLVGENTDGKGFLRSLREEAGEDPRGKRVVIIGAGGAARAIAVEMLLGGACHIHIANRTGSRARSLAAALVEAGGEGRVTALELGEPGVAEVVSQADIIVHTTSWGMASPPDLPPLIPAEWLPSDAVVCDIVYTPAETGLLRAAKARGCRVLPGLGMLLYQGAIAFEYWTGQSAPVDDMRSALRAALYG